MTTVAWLIIAATLVMGALGLAGWVVWRKGPVADRRLIKRIMRLPLRSKFQLAWAMYRDERVPAGLRLIPPALVLYLAMPVDIVPDFIPVLGQLDDVLVVILGVGLLFRLAGRSVVEEHLTDIEEAIGPQTGVEGRIIDA